MSKVTRAESELHWQYLLGKVVKIRQAYQITAQ